MLLGIGDKKIAETEIVHHSSKFLIKMVDKICSPWLMAFSGGENTKTPFRLAARYQQIGIGGIHEEAGVGFDVFVWQIRVL